jgi:hypothetical protein
MYESYTEGIVDNTLDLLAAICSTCIITALILAFHGNIKHLVEACNRLIGDLCNRISFRVTGESRMFTYGSGRLLGFQVISNLSPRQSLSDH